MNQRFEKLKTLLMELFQLDQPDLDFGFYRVMHAKSAEVTQFLEQDLLPQVRTAFAEYRSADKAEIERELARTIQQAETLGADPDGLPKVKELRTRLTHDAVDLDALEGEVYDHLFSFFRRYYSEGDFLSKRVYKPGVYAIPYEGEEVKLHWANADQYYIKTSEYLRDYAFRLRPDNEQNPMRVHFRLVDVVEGEHGNVKEASGKERRFRLAAESPIAVEHGELAIRFTYQPHAAKQKDLNAAAEEAILGIADPAVADWMKALVAKHARADGTESDATRLRVHLDRYTALNTFDYFIHKDLGAFLRRELDFYIKNEVMHLDDVENETAPRVEQYLSKIRVIRRIAAKIIDFVAQLEDFQKKLWLKKKFVVETSWCIRLGIIPEEFYPEIAANDAQREEWVWQCGIDEIRDELTSSGYRMPLTVEFLTSQPSLLLDSRHFPPEFVERVIAAVEDLESATDVLLCHGENAQSLRLMATRFREDVAAVYIDPPYNTAASAINYKNAYRNSSWLALVDERLEVAVDLMRRDAILCITIDDVELHNLRVLTDTMMSEYELLGAVAIKNNPAGRTGTVGFSICHEYALFYGRPGEANVGRLEHSEAQRARYKERDAISAFEWTNFRKHGGQNTYRTTRPRQFYPIYVRGENIRIPAMEWDNALREYRILEQALPDEETLWPVDENGRERIWDFVVDTARESIPHLRVRKDARGQTAVYRKWRLKEEGLLPQTWWDKSEYSAAEYGTNLLAHLFGETHRFAFPKSVFAVRDCLKVAGLRRESDGIALDFFAGSGTTAHAVMALNRADGGRRKSVLVEMGEHFDTVLLPRLKKVTYSPEWKDGKPKRFATPEEVERSPRIMKVVRLESYEDTLNNLELRRTDEQQRTLDLAQAQGAGKLKEHYVLRYMLDVETRGSQSLLNVAAFTDPTAYKLNVKRPGSDESREVSVDLLETFNWLIGLTVQHIAAPRTFSAAFKRDGDPDLPKDAPRRLHLDGRLKEAPNGPWWFRTVTGTTPDGRRTLVIWRKRPGGDSPEGVEQDNLVLDEWFTRQGYSSKDSEFDLIYVNGGNNLENLKGPDDVWKVRLIEEDFHRLMFDADGV